VTDRLRNELVWHRLVVVVSALTVLAARVPESPLPRQLLGIVFVAFIPGMAAAGRSAHLRRHGLWSAETWAVVVPISFAVGVTGSLLMVYLLPWAPSLLLVLIALACILSSLLRLRELDSGEVEET
jgi:uncharacterized membrane protein